VVVTREDIRKYGYQSVEEILQNIPGMYMIDDYNWTGTKNFGVRGFFSTGNFKNVIVMVNGVRQVNGVWDSYDTQSFSVPVQSTDRIEAVRGPMSVMYGSGAFFGAVNIFTNDQYNDDPVSMISASAGSDKTCKAYVRMSGRENDMSYSLNASYHTDDGVDVPFGDLMSDPSRATLPPPNWNLSTDRTDGLLDSERKSVSLAAKYKDLSVDLSCAASENGAPDAAGFGLEHNNRALHDDVRAYLTYEKKATDRMSPVLKGGYHRSDFEIDYRSWYQGTYAMIQTKDQTFEAELNAIINPMSDMNIIIGASMQQTEINNRKDIPMASNGLLQ
jgi:outer membrane receptor protein involved in Fe transport